MMSALLIKDFKFNIRYILISLLVVVSGFVLFCIDGGESSYLFSITLLPILMFGFDIGKLCYMDDKDKALTYLESLPFRKKDFIISKFIEGLIVGIVSILIILIENLILKNIFNIGFDISVNNIIYSLTFIIFYMGMFFILYYKYDISIIQIQAPICYDISQLYTGPRSYFLFLRIKTSAG